MRLEFKRRASQLTSEYTPNNEWDWYFLMQHHRLPTRLLDWTDSALIALFFAVSSTTPAQPEPESDAAVWMLDPWWLNSVSLRKSCVPHSTEPVCSGYLLDNDATTIRKRLPMAMNSTQVTKRMTAQRAQFTVFGSEPDGLSQVLGHTKRRLLKITIPKNAVINCRLDLVTCGITEATVFPDLEGLAREIERSWTDLWE